MSNRRANKRLRAKIRERMHRTGETYQQALTRSKRPSLIETVSPAALYMRAMALQAIAFRCEDPEQKRAIETEALLHFVVGRRGPRQGLLEARNTLRAHAAAFARR